MAYYITSQNDDKVQLAASPAASTMNTLDRIGGNDALLATLPSASALLIRVADGIISR